MKHVFLAVVLLVVPASLSRAGFDIDFTSGLGSGSISGPLVIDLEGGATLTVTGHTVSDSSATDDLDSPFGDVPSRDIYASSQGLSIKGPRGDSHEIDGAYKAEMMRLTFSEPVTLTWAHISYARGKDQLDLGFGDYPGNTTDVNVDETFGSDRISVIGEAQGSSTPDVYYDYKIDFSEGVFIDGESSLVSVTGQVFEFYTNSHKDDFKIAGIKGEFSGVTAPVPEITSLLVWAGVLTVCSRIRGRTRS